MKNIQVVKTRDAVIFFFIGAACGVVTTVSTVALVVGIFMSGM